jgi:CBS domain
MCPDIRNPGISAVILYKFLEQIVSDYMTHDVMTVPPAMSIRELGQCFKQTDFNSFPVVDNSQWPASSASSTILPVSNSRRREWSRATTT